MLIKSPHKPGFSRRKFIAAAPLIFIPRLIRAQAFTFNDPIFMAAKRPVAAGGPNAWFDVQDPATSDTDAFFSAGTTTEWATYTVPSNATGTATKLRLYTGTTSFGADNIKMALYSGTTLLSSGGPTVMGGASAWTEVPITPFAVTGSTTYKISWITQSGNKEVRYLAGVGTYDFASSDYASFPPSPLPGTSGTFARRYCVSMFVQ